MKNKIIITLFVLILYCKKTISKNTIYKNIIENISKEMDKIIEHLEEISKINNDNKTNITNCINRMKKTYQGNYSKSFLTKLFYDSSPTYEDIKNYYNCYHQLYTDVDPFILNNLTFVVVKYNDGNSSKDSNTTEYDISFSNFSKIFGICVPDKCSDAEYTEIIKKINQNYSLINGTINGAINLKPETEYSTTEILLQSLIPFLMISFILFIIEIKYLSGYFWSLFGFIFKKCNKKEYGEENIDKILKKKKLNQIDKLNGFIKLYSNIEEVMPGSKESQISNENGLHIVVGLRGIFIIGLFLGLTLQNIFIAPTRIFSNKKYRKIMNSYLYCFLFFFARISQKMLYALSGFELTYKLLFYFDNQLYKKYISSVQSIDLNNMNLNKYDKDNNNYVELSPKNSKENVNNLEQNNSKKNSLSSKTMESKKSKDSNLKSFKSKSINDEEDDEESEEYEIEEESDEFDEEEKKRSNLISKKKKTNDNLRNNRTKSSKNKKSKEIIQKKFVSSIDRGQIYLNYCNKLNFNILLSFHLRQFYLYFIFVFCIIYYLFWQTQYFAHLTEEGNLWMMITSTIKEYLFRKISTIFLFAGTCYKLRDYYNFYIPAMNEIFFYLFGSSLIYYSYKKNSRVDKILIIIIFLVILAKIIIYLIYKDDEQINFQPSLDFMQSSAYFLIQMHLLNLSYYCIGMIVGLANYSLQNDARKKKIVKEFVKLPRKLYYIIKRKYNFIFGLGFFIIFLICDILMYKIYLIARSKNDKENNEYIELEYFKSIFINIFNLLDCEIIIICIFILTIIVFYSSFSFLRDNFKSYPWKILSRIYFSLLLIGYKHSNWFFFLFAERITLDLTWVSFVLTLIFILSVGRSIFIYVLFQVPLKKLTKVIHVEKYKILDELKNLNNNERTNSMSIGDTSSIDLNANNTKCYINGRNQSDDTNEENDVIKTNYDLVFENKDENPL